MGPTLELDQRIPLPTPATPTACHSNPQAFDVDRGEVTDPAAADRIRQAKATCRTCPIAAACLRWALTHPDLTRIGVWAATTAPDRTALRRRLENRLGPNWVDVLAAETPSTAPLR
ncbi:WhiB family transcriptional regulator [Streptomyces mirabilis]|jgi:Transcription factor WhiB.|uniref:WhiB family transcriptional regulator n=1 Tax=Streptomyces mirabilis TaxID=68239 RepID=UPI000765E5F6